MSLRARLVIGLVALAGAGLLAADVATFTSLRAFLVRRVDQQLDATRFGVLRAMAPGRRGGAPVPPGQVQPGTYAEIRDGADAVLDSSSFVPVGDPEPKRPALPSHIEASRPITVRAEGGGAPRFRVLATPLEDGLSLVVAVPLSDVDATLARLLVIEGAVTILVLAGLVALALWVVRLGMRPLGEIEETAAAIAAGDLSRRIERAEPRTEIGRLGLALNAMLAQIEEAFAARRASEDRLRRFLADASHELRTPLTSIRGYAELFRRGADVRPDDLEKSMRRIESEAGRMGVLVDDLLLLARLDQGRQLEHEPVDLAGIARDAVDDARAVDPDRPISLDAQPAVVDGDERRLRQVAANLLSNALTHTPSGTPVTVRVAAEDGWAVLEVADRGPGFDDETAAKVFERFYRADPSRARDSGGMGLGLSIVAAIAAAHGGRATVRSAPGEGAAFTVRVPATARDGRLGPPHREIR